MRYAQGYNALAICDRCGFRLKYLDLITEQDTNLRVCETCLDESEPIRFRGLDAIVLRNPRPDPFEGEGEFVQVVVPVEHYLLMSSPDELVSTPPLLFMTSPTVGVIGLSGAA